jgi:hypothetical protein
MLAKGPIGFTPAFTEAARNRLREANAKKIPTFALFTTNESKIVVPTPHLNDVLIRARSLYGVGMGIASLGVLTSVVRATLGLRWGEDSEMAEVLAIVDVDLTQAIQVSSDPKKKSLITHSDQIETPQSSKEELESEDSDQNQKAAEIISELRTALESSDDEVTSWGGEVPFERGLDSIKFLKVGK